MEPGPWDFVSISATDLALGELFRLFFFFHAFLLNHKTDLTHVRRIYVGGGFPANSTIKRTLLLALLYLAQQMLLFMAVPFSFPSAFSYKCYTSPKGLNRS